MDPLGSVLDCIVYLCFPNRLPESFPKASGPRLLRGVGGVRVVSLEAPGNKEETGRVVALIWVQAVEGLSSVIAKQMLTHIRVLMTYSVPNSRVILSYGSKRR